MEKANTPQSETQADYSYASLEGGERPTKRQLLDDMLKQQVVVLIFFFTFSGSRSHRRSRHGEREPSLWKVSKTPLFNVCGGTILNGCF